MGAEGSLSRILENEGQGVQARQSSPKPMLAWMSSLRGLEHTARGDSGFFPASAVGDDVELYTYGTNAKSARAIPLPPPQSNTEGMTVPILADFNRAEETGFPDHLGAFAVTIGSP